jgi:hypothetical protein
MTVPRTKAGAAGENVLLIDVELGIEKLTEPM